MALVQLAACGFSPVVDSSGNARPALPFTLTTLAGATATIYADAGYAAQLVTADKVTGARGTLPGYVAEGTYTFAVDGVTETVEVVSGRAGLLSLGGVPDGVTDNTAAWLAAYTAAPSGSVLVLGPGTYVGTLPTIAKDNMTIRGAGEHSTVIKPPASMSSGYVVDVTANGFTLEGVTIQGGVDYTTPIATGSAGGIRLRGGSSRHLLRDVQVLYFLTTGYGLAVQGSQSNEFYGLAVEGCNLNMIVSDSTDHVSSGNQNVFYAPKIQRSQLASGAAIEIRDCEGTVFHGGLVQSNKGLKAVLVTNTASGNGPGRGNAFDAVWFEENGNSQASSHGIHIEGYDSAHPIVNTRILNSMLTSSNQNNPASQIYLTNADSTIIEGNYSNLGSPNKAVEYGLNTTATRYDRNNFAGDVSGSDTPTSVASAATLPMPTNVDFVTVTGTTTVTSIANNWRGRVIRLLFQSSLTVTDGGTLKLNGDYVTTADDMLQLVGNGTNWYELSRSAN